MMRNDRFTEQAQEVISASQQLVRDERHPQWDVEHVFFALLALPNGLARDIFSAASIDADPVSYTHLTLPTILLV